MKVGLGIVRNKLGIIVQTVREFLAMRKAYTEKQLNDTGIDSNRGSDDDTMSSSSSTSSTSTSTHDVLIYCWRGGLRSASVAFMLKECGYQCVTLKGGYKGFRKWARLQVGDEEPVSRSSYSNDKIRKNKTSGQSDNDGNNNNCKNDQDDVHATESVVDTNNNQRLCGANDDVASIDATPIPTKTPSRSEGQTESSGGGHGNGNSGMAKLPYMPQFCVIGGRTGVGKTKLLRHLHDIGEQVLDLEDLASHRGSVFGWVGEVKQPSNEQFLNNVAVNMSSFQQNKWVYVEDEGRHVGHVHVPNELYNAIRQAPLVIKVQCSRNSRLDILVQDYANSTVQAKSMWLDGMKKSVSQLRKRFGDENVAKVIAGLDEGDWRKVADLLLPYYDKLYDKHIQNETGTGSGTGTRQGVILSIGHDDVDFDEVQLAEHIVKITSAATF